MQRREFNCVSIGVANTAAMSGRAIAEQIDRGLRTGKEKSVWRIACSTFLWSSMVAGLFIVLAPMPARADDDKDRRGDNDTRAQIAINPLQVALLKWAPYSGVTFHVGSGPTGVAFDGASIWVTNGGSNSVTKLRASDGANLGTFAVGFFPFGVACDGANIWVTNAGSASVTKLRASDGANLGNFPVTAPGGIAFDGANIWVVNNNNQTIIKLRASDGVTLGTFSLGLGGYAGGVAFDGANIWVVTYVNNSVTKLRASDGANLGSFPVSGPGGIAFDGANIWVTSSGNSVTKL